MKIPWLNFEQWGYSGGRWFVARRVYRQGWKWTPFVWLERRYGRLTKCAMADSQNEPLEYIGDGVIRANTEKGIIEWVIPNPECLPEITLCLRPEDIRFVVQAFAKAAQELGADV